MQNKKFMVFDDQISEIKLENQFSKYIDDFSMALDE